VRDRGNMWFRWETLKERENLNDQELIGMDYFIGYLINRTWVRWLRLVCLRRGTGGRTFTLHRVCVHSEISHTFRTLSRRRTKFWIPEFRRQWHGSSTSCLSAAIYLSGLIMAYWEARTLQPHFIPEIKFRWLKCCSLGARLWDAFDCPQFALEIKEI